MSKHFNDIFVATNCPSQQQLLDYVQGKLKPEEQHEVEMHLSDCELCSEALEGLAAIQQQEKIPGWLREMKWELLRKLHKRTRVKRKQETYIYLAVIILAVIFLMLGLFWAYHFSLRR